MARGDLVVFDKVPLHLGEEVHTLNAADTIKCMLSSTAVGSITGQETATSSFTEVSGDNYTAGGATLTCTYGESSGVTTFDSTTNPSWTQHATGPNDIRTAIVYNATAAGVKDVLCYVDMTNDGTTAISLRDGDISITWSGSGLFTFTV